MSETAEVKWSRQSGPCRIEGCSHQARSQGYCDTHYRRVLRRRRGVGGIQPIDGAVYKIRVRSSNGTQPIYYSKLEAAQQAAKRYSEEGRLLYFGKYSLEEVIDLDSLE